MSQQISFRLSNVLVCSGGYNKIPQTGWPTNRYSHFWRLKVQDQGVSMIRWWPSSWFLERAFSLCPLVVGGSTHPVHEAPFSWADHFPKALPSSTIMLGIRISTCEFCGGHKYPDLDKQCTIKTSQNSNQTEFSWTGNINFLSLCPHQLYRDTGCISLGDSKDAQF